MNLIILYGPPAVGKLSVATELSKMTGYKLLHNHLAIDFVESIFNRSDKEFWKLIDEYRLDIIKKAAKNNIQGIILTTVNIKGTDDEFIKKLIKIMDDNSGKALFVHLISDINEIKKRLTAPSREQFGKLTNVKIFNEFISKNNVFEPIPFVESLKINNTAISPKETATIIKKHYGL